jgi:hypothetical protein
VLTHSRPQNNITNLPNFASAKYKSVAASVSVYATNQDLANGAVFS